MTRPVKLLTVQKKRGCGIYLFLFYFIFILLREAQVCVLDVDYVHSVDWPLDERRGIFLTNKGILNLKGAKMKTKPKKGTYIF